ncbi:MAG TPA: c-type cytochrome [Steroidobacteraceae bacterium]|nr:c-type cytochrome [Steroidobacteraceae bacterium]
MHRSRSLLVLALALSTATAAENAKQAKPEAASSPLYQVQDGTKVDAKTLAGWKTWRALACERCHGAEQEGLVGPPLVESMKNLSKEDFHAIMMNGRPEKGMPPFNTSPMVNENWEGLYAYLKGRSDGKIAPGRLTGAGQP